MKYFFLILMILLTACASTPEAAPSPTPAPSPQAVSTRLPTAKGESSRALPIMHVAGTILSVDIAVHPVAGWPAVVAVEDSLTTHDPPHIFVRAYNPVTQRWGSSQSIGRQGSALFSRFRTAQIVITADNTLHLVWGPGRTPWLGLYASESHDYGETWTAPRLIAHDSYGVFDLTAAIDGTLFVLANSESRAHPMLIRRTSAGQWQAPELLPMPSWYGSTGAISVTGEGTQALVTLVSTGGGASSADNMLFSAQRQGDSGAWHVERHSVSTEKPDFIKHVRAMPVADPVLFTFALDAQSDVYVLKVNKGHSQQIMHVVESSAKVTPFVAAAYDPLTERSIVLWTCCVDATFVAGDATHYARWSTGDDTEWLPQETTPLLTGAISAADLASAQAMNSRQVWLVWAEGVHDVVVRSLDLDLVH